MSKLFGVNIYPMSNEIATKRKIFAIFDFFKESNDATSKKCWHQHTKDWKDLSRLIKVMDEVSLHPFNESFSLFFNLGL